ncbi:hypothetical protein CP965_12995 [Halarcobacter mediterraneus]|uniref:DUF4878 domain-containing protein n=1 Tax=Halarcobacter mediterraneus TaxID=2023153 RepID=A0A4Q1AST1_9BACT|nr:hypothetical protein [Halarcobacter mediterraneus]RXK11681.1 hypothetical protein CP965_12995 [Halarcobacter mediterraneus]
MKNKIKIGIVGVVSTLVLSGCMESSPENVVENYISGLKNADFNQVSKTVSSDIKDEFSRNIIFSCGTNKKFKDKVIPLLNKENIDSKVLDRTSNGYQSFSSEIQNKTVSFCFKEIMTEVMEKQKDTKMKILNSEVSSSGNEATVKFEETNSQGKSKQHTVKLEKINKEWKIIDGVL